MKNIIIYLSALPFIIMAAGCDTDPEDKTLVPEEGLTLSEWALDFPQAGGTLFVGVAANVQWGYSSDETWIVMDNNGDQMEITVEANDTGDDRHGIVYVRTSNLEKTVYISQSCNVSVNLSDTGNANCYIAKPDGAYMFDATLKGNGGSDGNSQYIETYGLKVEGAVRADLLWESTFDGDKTRSREIIAGNPILKDGYVYFSTGNVEGNAVIAVKSMTGAILWSWHIWVVREDISIEECNGFKWMDRNLGAINNTPKDINNRGLMYQWGRKDPFLPTYVPYDGLYATALRYNPDNTETGNGSGKWNYRNFMALQLVRAPGHIPFSVEMPMTYIQYYGDLYNGTEDWYISERNEAELTSFLWGDFEDVLGKTIFDPCPAGYVIPPGDAFILKDSQVEEAEQWSINSTLCEEFDFGARWKEGNDAYFPLAGHRIGLDGELVYCGNLGIYWTRHPISDVEHADTIYMITLQDPSDPDYLIPFYVQIDGSNSSRSSAHSIRCIKE